MWIDESGYSCSVRTERKNGHTKTTKGMLKYDSHLAINFRETAKSLGWYSLNAHQLAGWLLSRLVIPQKNGPATNH